LFIPQSPKDIFYSLGKIGCRAICATVLLCDLAWLFIVKAPLP
jgi:hypothetical protein